MSATELLGQFVGRYTTSPLVLGRRIDELSRTEAGEFAFAAAAVLRSYDGSRGFHHLIRVLAERKSLHLVLLRLANLDVEAMARVTRDLIATDPLFDAMQLVRDLIGPNGPASQSPQDLLGALGVACQRTKLFPLISNLLKGLDSRFNSKAVLTIGKASESVDFLIRQSEDPDPRVCANAIEALWGQDAARVIDLFHRMKKRGHQRIVANALIGLCRAGYLDGLRGLAEMTQHPSSAFRASAAWAMGTVGDPRFVPILKHLLKEPPGAVGRNSLRSLQRIQAARLSAVSPGLGVLPVFRCQFVEQGAVEAVVAAYGLSPRLLPQVRPIQWSVESGGKEPILDFEVEAKVSPVARLAVLAPLPQEDDTLRLQAVEKALELALSLKRQNDGCLLLPYRTTWIDRPLDSETHRMDLRDLEGPEMFWRPWRDPEVRDRTLGTLNYVTQLALDIVQRHLGPRHILLVVDGTSPDRPSPEQLTQTLDRIHSFRVTAHVALLADPDGELAHLLAPQIEQTGGTMLSGVRPEDLPELIAGLATGQAIQYRITFKPPTLIQGGVAAPIALSYQTLEIACSAFLFPR